MKYKRINNFKDLATLQVGELATMNGTLLTAAKARNGTCIYCIFAGTYCMQIPCTQIQRSDRQHVYFTEVTRE